MTVTLVKIGETIWVSRRPASDFIHTLTLLSECVPCKSHWKSSITADVIAEATKRPEVSISVVGESSIEWLAKTTANDGNGEDNTNIYECDPQQGCGTE